MRRTLYELKTVLAQHPAPALRLARWRGRGVPLGRDTDVVIEGYPRSANTFSVAAFRMAQPREVRIAHHLHAPAHVIVAIRRGLPALVLVRDPEDAVLEFVIRNPHLAFRQAIRGWLRFYEPLLPHRDGFVVGRFRDVTSDFGAVIRRLNERFGTGFREFEHTEENVRTCFDAIERDYRRAFGAGPDMERVVARPSRLREEIKERLRGEYRSESLADLRRRAEALAATFTSEDG